MLIPSIDLLGGRIVQLVQGEKLRLAFDDFEYWIEKFSKYPLVQLIDLDAAKRQGDNGVLVEQIAKRLPVQVGGGIHTVERARQVLEAGSAAGDCRVGAFCGRGSGEHAICHRAGGRDWSGARGGGDRYEKRADCGEGLEGASGTDAGRGDAATGGVCGGVSVYACGWRGNDGRVSDRCGGAAARS
jgi:hypothetical protein